MEYALQVPYIVYGGPKLEPGDSPSPDLPQLGESLVIAEFLADTFPSARLLPATPFIRAKARLFSRAVEETYSPASIGFVFKQTPKEELYAAVERRARPGPAAPHDWLRGGRVVDRGRGVPARVPAHAACARDQPGDGEAGSGARGGGAGDAEGVAAVREDPDVHRGEPGASEREEDVGPGEFLGVLEGVRKSGM